ncbi:MAG: iron uptake transporter permease EfeU [Anaerolineales bacterium]|nr:iron uptake transporter permease EfeU [Anaerolineales bacterium]
MFASFLLSLREGIEAALIIGIVLGTLRKIKRTDLAPRVWYGAISAAVLSLAAGILLTSLGLQLKGKAEEIFEGFAMIVAAGVLTWMIFWMRRQARHIKERLESGVEQAALQMGRHGLFALAFLAALREGIELALFLTAAVFASSPQQTIIGGLLGLGTAILLGWLLFFSTIQLNLQRFFQVTGALLLLFAAGLVAHGIHEFNEVGWIPGIIEHVWNTNSIIDESSTLGVMLKALFGYNGNPSLTEVIAYLAYLGGIIFALRETENKTVPAAEAA